MKQIRILFLEECQLLRECVSVIINAQPDIRVMASTHGRSNILHLAHTINPHVLLIGLGSGNRNGLQIAKSVIRELQDVKVIGMGLLLSRLEIVELAEMGASAINMIDATGDDCLRTIRSVARGEVVLPKSPNASVDSRQLRHNLEDGKGGSPNFVRMTRREHEVSALIARGLSNKEIAQRLRVETYTVKSHVHNILGKLALRSRLQLSSYIHNEGAVSRWIDPPHGTNTYDFPPLSLMHR